MRPHPAARPSSARLVAIGAIVVALACLVGLASRPAGQPGSSGGGHPEVLLLVGQVFLFLIAAAAVVVGVLIVSAFWQGRRGGRDPEDPQKVIDPPAPWAERMIALGLALALLAFAAGVVWLALHFAPGGNPGRVRTPAAIAFPTRRALPGASPTATSPLLTWVAAAAALTIVLAAALATIWWLRRRRPVLVSTPQPGPRVAEAVEEGLDALRSDPDPRRAVIRAYGAMERSLAAAGAGRRQFEAPYEYLQRVLAQVAAPPDQVSVLTRLFGLAKFSQHRIDEAARGRAIEALASIREQRRNHT